jgi:hypothetical protein
VLDADIRGFFDNISHEWTLKFIEHSVADRRMLRLIRKWLKAGVSEDGQWSEMKQGTPQGAVVSPLLANVYLHYVFDEGRRRRSGEREEPHQGSGAGQGGVAVPHLEAGVWPHQSALPGLKEESPVAVRGLRAGQSPQIPQAAG